MRRCTYFPRAVGANPPPIALPGLFGLENGTEMRRKIVSTIDATNSTRCKRHLLMHITDALLSIVRAERVTIYPRR